MTKQELFNNILSKKTFLCIGLDTDITKIPEHLLKYEDPVFEFNKQIIEATKDLCIAYKPNIAFYESLGPGGWESLKRTLTCIPDNIFTIADAKRGDIANTSKLYAKTFFETFDFDAVTVNPYMGRDSVIPFLSYKGKWAIILALTSNEGASDFQASPRPSPVGRETQRSKSPHNPSASLISKPMRKVSPSIKSEPRLHRDKLRGDPESSGTGLGGVLFEEVLMKSKQWGSEENIMYVVGAARPEMINTIRRIVPDHFLLVPGIGSQGGDLNEVAKFGMNKQCGLLINASRSIIYAGDGQDFAEKAREQALAIKNEMEILIRPLRK